MVWFGHLTLKMTGPSPDLTCRKAEFWAGSEEPGQNDVTMIVFFPLEKHLAFFKNSLELVSLLIYATYCSGRGRRRLRRQAWVLAESSRTRHSHESTGTDYSLRRPHPLTPTRPGPTTLECFPAQHGLHHIQNRRLHGPTRSAIISFLTTRYGRTALQDSTDVEMCSFGRQSRSDTPFPGDSNLFSSLLCYSSPPLSSRHVDRRLGAPSPMKPRPLAQGSITTLST